MSRVKLGRHGLYAASALAIATAMMGTSAMAQVSTSTIRGYVSDSGQMEPGAIVSAREVSSGFSSRATVNAEGAYVLPGLRPGTYEVTVTTTDGQTVSEVVTIGVGQTGELDLDVGTEIATAGADDATQLEEVVVTGRRLVEMRTSEVATNVSTTQISQLPQNSRNFLNFAGLAPGVRVSTDPERQTFSSGALSANNTNVFIDGQSLKNNVLQGGIAGQDASRGNPFPQGAIQEFRVSTQNHKAEYEQAGSAIITAVTRSGTNEIQGELFAYYQDDSMLAEDYFDEQAGREQPEYSREQYGGWISGPILRDRLHYFLTYEANNQDRATQVNLNTTIPQAIRDQYDGAYVVPFRSELIFGKLSWTPAANHSVDLSVTRRTESDIRDFGGGTVRERATDIQIDTTSVNLRWSWTGDNFLNEASFDYLDAFWAPSAASDGVSRQTQDGGGFPTLAVGARTFLQDKGQTGYTFRNDLTFTNLGDHLVKMGIKVARLEYSAYEASLINPLYIYAPGDYTFSGDPVQAQVGLGNPVADGDNTQIGLYIQDDWDITDKLQLNLGLRWDYESNMMNNDFVTPAALATALRNYTTNPDINWEDYISTGSNRESFTGAFQPRVGFNYDVYDDNSLVIFGGWGRYYDRVLYDFAQVEYNRSNYFVTTVSFGEGLPWNDSYLDADNLRQVAAFAGTPEAYLLNNDVKMPYSDQLSLGVRKQFGDWTAGFTYTRIRSYDGFSWVLANRFEGGGFRNENGDLPWCCFNLPANHPDGYGAIIVSESADESSYDGFYVTLDKPYNAADGWGFNLAYTYADAEEYGHRSPTALDEPNAAAWGWHPAEGAEDHRLVMSGILDLPWGITGSTLITLGSGQRYQRVEFVPGQGAVFSPGAGVPEKDDFILPDVFAFRQVDLRFTKDFDLPNGQQVGLIVDAINVFNFKNFGYDEWSGQATRLVSPVRSFQVGVRYRF